jgi:hypothetical protein
MQQPHPRFESSSIGLEEHLSSCSTFSAENCR